MNDAEKPCPMLRLVPLFEAFRPGRDGPQEMTLEGWATVAQWARDDLLTLGDTLTPSERRDRLEAIRTYERIAAESEKVAP